MSNIDKISNYGEEDFFQVFNDLNILSIDENKLPNIKQSYSTLLSNVLGMYERFGLLCDDINGLEDIISYLKYSQSEEDKRNGELMEKILLKYKFEYIDRHTGFWNMNKLKKDIEKYEYNKGYKLIRLKLKKIGEIDIAYGENITDDIIFKTGEKIKEKFNVGNIYRLYGGEFALITEGVSEKDVEKNIHNIEKEDLDIRYNDIKIQVNLEAGISNIDNGSDGNDAIYKSFISLHTPYDNRKIKTYDPSKHTNQNERKIHSWIKIVEDVLNSDLDNYQNLDVCKGFIPYFQQIKYNGSDNYTDENLWKMECLARMKDQHSNLVSPNYFLPPLDRTGKTYLLTEILIKKTFKVLEENGLINKSLISFNLSGENILEDDFIDFLLRETSQYNIKPQNIILEILEDTEYYNEILERIRKLKTHGFRIAIDDFGTSNSNFWTFINNLSNIDYLKIDKKFIWNLKEDTVRTVIKNFTDLAHKNGIEIVAEGIEDQETQDILEEIGVDYSQGFYFSKPSENPKYNY